MPGTRPPVSRDGSRSTGVHPVSQTDDDTADDGGDRAGHGTQPVQEGAAPSVTMWPASAGSASETPRQPASAATRAKPPVRASAMNSRQRWSGLQASPPWA